MSSDDYWLIGKHPSGGWGAAHGFASSPFTPVIKKEDRRFDSCETALFYATEMGSEYGCSLMKENPEVANWDFNFSDDLHAAIFQAVGAASACWSNLDGAGVFHSERAKAIGDTIVARVQVLEAERDRYRKRIDCALNMGRWGSHHNTVDLHPEYGWDKPRPGTPV